MPKENLNQHINSNRRKLLSLAGAASAGALLSPLLSKAAPSTIIEAGSNVDTASYIIFKDGGIIYAKNGMTGAIQFSGAGASTVIQWAIDILPSPNKGASGYNVTSSVGGRIHIKSGTYSIESGISLKSYTQIIMEPGTLFMVPNGYSSYVFKLLGSNNKRVGFCNIQGGNIREAGSPQRLWDAFLLQSTDQGIYFNIFKDTRIFDCNRAVHLYIDGTTGWINGNGFENIVVFYPNHVVDFDNPAFGDITQNCFQNILGQGGTNTLCGYKNIQTKQNLFIQCMIWDLEGAQISGNIADSGNGTIIIGGSVAARNFTDNGINSKILDVYNGVIFSPI